MVSVLVLGNGGREHAICWKLSKCSQVDSVYVSPGNAAPFSNVDLDPTNAEKIVEFCSKNDVVMVVVGPEAPLAAGIVDKLQKLNPNLHVFGPSQAGAMLETSKIFSKQFMTEFSLPTARYIVVNNETDVDLAVDRCDWNGIVVKADGLAAGKGVVVARSKDEAKQAARSMLKGEFGASGHRILLEETLQGYEVSALAFIDGKNFLRMPLVRDHKRLLNGDRGPNTGGMGVISPVNVSEDVNKKIDEIFEKTISGLQKRGIVYKGVLYAGLMVVGNEPHLLEFNCRFGDPETQVLMRLLKSDLYEIFLASVNGCLKDIEVEWEKSAVCGVVVAAGSYPKSSDKGTPITNLPPDTDSVYTFHAGTAISNGQIVTNGGRIVCVTAIGDNLEAARKSANEAAENVEFRGRQFRTDIGLTSQEINSLSYGSSGVNIEEGNAFVEDIKKLVAKTILPGTGQIGGFGAVIDLKESGFSNDAQLVVGIDGVGTKIEVASAVNDFSGVGYDVVAMCVNDVLCHCARPLAFLDYFVCGKLDRKMATKVLASISDACVEAGCSLIGGETAEMPGVYNPHQWDLAGCAIAVREKSWPELPLSKTIAEGDILIGLPSSGLHSNGFSLVRNILRVNKVDYNEPTPWDSSHTFGQVLLKGTRLYVSSVLPLLKDGLVKGCAHITGGGILENAIRVLEKTSKVALSIDGSTWTPPPIFQWLTCNGPVQATEMLRTFNCGIGMVLVVSPSDLAEVERRFHASKEEYFRIGNVVQRTGEELIELSNKHQLFNYDLYKTNRRKVKVGILISGVGSNMLRLIERAAKADSNCEVVVVISNRPEALGLQTAANMGIPTVVVPHTKDRVTGDKKLAQTLIDHDVELICLGGYMRILSEDFVKRFPQRIINIHPSLLPSFKGAHALREALEFGAKVVGCTVHYVDELVDHGAIIAQKAVSVEVNDSLETLQAKIQKEEHIVFPEAMISVAEKILSKQ